MAELDFDTAPDQTNRNPHFDFRDLPPSRTLTYRLLTWDNYLELYHLFKNDPAPFVDQRFKSQVELKTYAEYQLEYAWYSAKRAGCDWLFLKDNQYAGVIHLYDLSLDTRNNRHRRCTIGFATAATYRHQGLTTEAVQHLLQYVFESLEMHSVLAYTLKGNRPSINFMEHIGFVHYNPPFVNEADKRKYYYYLLYREAFGM